MRIALVDIDSIIIAAGALAEDVYYLVDTIRFDYKSQANEWCDQNGRPKEDIVREVDVKPVSHAINILNTALNAAVREAECQEYEAYLSPSDKSNFRFTVYEDYKANRKNVVKPQHFEALRKHAVKHLKAQVVVGMEADDMLSIRAHELGFENCVIVSIDKDMRQVPCYHYDWRKKGKVEKVEVHAAQMNFYTQVLVGDSVDNIKGCPGIGPAKAAARLKDCATEDDMVKACAMAYIEAYDGDETEAKKQFKLNATLIHLLNRRPGS